MGAIITIRCFGSIAICTLDRNRIQSSQETNKSSQKQINEFLKKKTEQAICDVLIYSIQSTRLKTGRQTNRLSKFYTTVIIWGITFKMLKEFHTISSTCLIVNKKIGIILSLG